jgi:hypothetical protein
MKGKEEKTVTVFRVWLGKGGVIALFPQNDVGSGYGYCSSYEHVGQHSWADYRGVIARTRPATPNEYRDLLKELRKIGYNVVIRQRWTRR